MSLINQVLNNLERRGAQEAFKELPIRAVPAQRKTYNILYVIVLIGVILIFALLTLGSKINEVTKKSPVLAVAASAIPTSVSAESSVSSLKVSDTLVIENLPINPAQEQAIASHLSFELSSIPLPNSLRPKPHANANLALAAKTPTKPSLPARNIAVVSAVADISSNQPSAVNKQLKTESPRQQAENEFRQAYALAQQGLLKEAAAGYERALKLDASHDMARQSLVAVLLDSKRNAEAEKVLHDTLVLNPKDTHYAMLLARLQVERNALTLALDTLKKTLPFAEQQADYQAFMAALLQQQNRHQEAITHYQVALQLSPNAGLWLMGLGISLQALKKNDEATDAFQRALNSHKLSPELEAFIGQRLKELKR